MVHVGLSWSRYELRPEISLIESGGHECLSSTALSTERTWRYGFRSVSKHAGPISSISGSNSEVSLLIPYLFMWRDVGVPEHADRSGLWDVYIDDSSIAMSPTISMPVGNGSFYLL